MRKILLAIAVTFLAASGPAKSAQTRTICVHLFSSRNPPAKIEILSATRAQLGGTEFLIDGKWTVRAEHSLVVARLSNTRRVFEGPSLTLFSANGKGMNIRVDRSIQRAYHGTIRVEAEGRSTLRVRNYVSERDYVTAVVGSEAPPDSPLEMLKAQAILSQTLLARMQPNEIIEDSTQTQVYGGSTFERPEVRAAVGAVAGKLLIFDGHPATIYFHSTCAGRTSSARDYFDLKPGSLPYLKSVPCKYCKESPFWKETIRTMPLKEWEKAFGEPLPVVAERDLAERPVRIALRGTFKESGYAFWLAIGKKFGWDKVPGTRFEFKQLGDNIELRSTGAGHGVGLCQWGAIGLARQGKNFREIINYYYTGCKIQ